MSASRIDHLVAEIRQGLPRRLQASEFADARDRRALIVDIRPIEQRSRDGELPGSVVIDRNVLEWRLDPTSPNRIPEAREDAEIVVVCNEGFSSSIAAETLQRIGLAKATDLAGGFQALLRFGKGSVDAR